ncbi:MAG TPA: pentapeptide repeat-containing protein [Longimicrobium sp.]
MSRSAPGRIITFYSYKGGTGRSMALANVAWTLASHGKRVICVDWDLEAPGLHRYFAPFLIDADLYSTPGLIDLVWSVSRAAVTPVPDGERRASRDGASLSDLADIGDYIVRLDWEFPHDGVLDLLPAGQQGATYAERVNAMDWDHFYERLGGGKTLNALRERLKESYDYVLIDSRTGVSDTSGICTVQMPDALAVLFTLNKQSMRGAEAVALSVRDQRPEMPIFPVPTRVDPFEIRKLAAALQKARSTFAPFVDHLRRTRVLRGSGANDYWGDVEFPYVPYFSYEEVLAPFAETQGRKSTILSAATRLTRYISGERIGEPQPIPDEVASEYLSQYAHDPRALRAAPTAAQTASSDPGKRLRFSLGRWAALAAVTILIVLFAGSALFRRGKAPATRSEKLALVSSAFTPPDQRVELVRQLYIESRVLGGVDLSGLDLSRLNLTGIDLRNATLRNTRLVNAVLDSAVLAGARLQGANLTGARLLGANLAGAALSGANLSGANLFQSDLTDTPLDSATTNALTVLSDSTMGPYRRDEDVDLGAAAATQLDSSTVGYVWLGNYNREQGRWEKVRIADMNDRPVAADPSVLQVGGRYRLRGDLTLRQKLPKNDAGYFSNVVSLGWAPRGSTVTLLDRPVAFQRPNRVQYWARVRVDRLMNGASGSRADPNEMPQYGEAKTE